MAPEAMIPSFNSSIQNLSGENASLRFQMRNLLCKSNLPSKTMVPQKFRKSFLLFLESELHLD
jgi:hypothetical protein